MVIRSEAEYHTAQQRIDHLTSDDFVSINDVAELRHLLSAVAAWEAREFTAILHETGPSPSVPISTDAQYQAAVQRRADLAGCLEDTPEERELIKVQLAIEVWETKHRMG